tara:strand:+ start:551 stop:754 length:204 start_codon:yes stop_codon:yes gene_type:complete
MAYTKDQLATKYKDLLANYTAGKLYGTEDGQVFYTEDAAKVYANTRGLKVYELNAAKKTAKKDDKTQ